MGVYRFAGRDGVALACRETWSGRPLVLLHGFMGAGSHMLGYGRTGGLAEQGYRLIVPDFRGHGDSAKPHDPAAYPPDVLADDGLALVGHLGLGDGEYDLGGYSLGGRIVVRMLVRGAKPGRAIVAGQGLAKVSGPQGGGVNHRVLTADAGMSGAGLGSVRESRRNAPVPPIGADVSWVQVIVAAAPIWTICVCGATPRSCSGVPALDNEDGSGRRRLLRLRRAGWRLRVDRLGGIAAIGGTPVVRLARLAGEGCAEVWVKMEAANPTGSYKDRMALAMIEAAEADGRLRPGQLVVEYTGGSTGSSLAFVCAVKGYPLRIVSSDAFADEKIRTMRAFGAEVELIPSPDGITPGLIPSMMRRAAEITAQTGAFAPDQFNNTDMVDGYRRLGEELLDQLPGPPPISAFCSYVGTAGCFLGVSRALAAALPDLHRAVVEPAESAVLSGGPPGTHHIEGGGIGHRPPQLHATDYDEVVAVPEAKAFQTARQAARTEGIFSGPSTGANLAAAAGIARRLGPGHRVVTIQVDSGLKYLAGQLYS